MDGEYEQAKVVLDKDSLMKMVENYELVKTIEVPELEGSPVLKVRGASLNDHIKARKMAGRPMVLLMRFLDRIKSGGTVDVDNIEKEIAREELDPDFLFEIEMFSRCVIDPIFTLAETVALSKAFPSVVNRVVKFALGITQSGRGDDGN